MYFRFQWLLVKSQTKVVFFANFSGLVKYLWVKQGVCPRVERLKGALDLGKLCPN
jgi:hypothetical protein